MEFKILDKKEIGGRRWFLCKGLLYDYISTLKRDFSEFHIQRRIVKNGYLDNILKTVVDGEPMPTITLTCSPDISMEGDKMKINPDNIEILDGLQRTFRMWVFWNLTDLINKEGIIDYRQLAERLKKPNLEYIKRVDFVNASYLKSILDSEYRGKVLNAYMKYELYFVVWEGLKDQEIVEKMLVLNAGQRPVSSTHQFEILFLHYFDKDKLIYNSNIRLLREKDPDYYMVKHGKRKTGEYALTSIIIAIQSYLQAKPLRIASANKLIYEEEPIGDVRNYRCFFTEDSLSQFINSVYKLDEGLSKLGEDYRIWYGKDTTLSGVYAALGNCKEEDSRSIINLNADLNKLLNILSDFDINGYNKAYSELSSIHINVGQRVREAVFTYTKALLENNKISWSKAFNRNSGDDEDTTYSLF